MRNLKLTSIHVMNACRLHVCFVSPVQGLIPEAFYLFIDILMLKLLWYMVLLIEEIRDMRKITIKIDRELQNR